MIGILAAVLAAIEVLPFGTVSPQETRDPQFRAGNRRKGLPDKVWGGFQDFAVLCISASASCDRLVSN
jgi:hypothetical protein